jgi:hypothetical protein
MTPQSMPILTAAHFHNALPLAPLVFPTPAFSGCLSGPDTPAGRPRGYLKL